jgi:hypothetical protein
MVVMAHWQASTTRAPPKSKAELREMLTEAVRNTRTEADEVPERPSKAEAAPQVD